MQADPDFPVGQEMARAAGHHTTLGIPLLREGVAIGAFVLGTGGFVLSSSLIWLGLCGALTVYCFIGWLVRRQIDPPDDY